ncbi:Flavodoxin reductases (ferredoxin-NADPH reductases) family 1 [Pantoea sp. AS-PWVM4]|uniref:PDR/VanB family oxidoreductase n=1 Tax=Pantoea sp. AS-PWVM4 TaxID=1332069 RepID=UPI0003AC7151|nr:PDR/VanB family oxidoreductase [Pantoea sp. AS-PWVM4]ERK15155.1 Flavodoxin reductases (ferredoxin-NADPH reductases) family 1 [Pantoea sp. AS-PWVM4]
MKQAENLAVTVIAKQFNGAGNVLLTLASASGHPLPVFTPGAHIDVTIPDCGKRQYSLCSAAGEAHYQVCVRLDQASGGGSRWLHHQVQTGTRLTISAPRNHFPLPEAPRTLLFAAGIGLTPLLVMAEHLAAQNAEFTLHLFLKRHDELPFSARLDQLGSRVVLHYSSEGDSLRQRVPEDLKVAHNSVLVSCGPAGFMEHLHQLAQQHGWGDDQLHSEKFKPDVTTQSIAGDVFTVEIASSGARHTINADESIAEVLERAGIDIELSCEQGMCGACITGVLSGEPDHRDEVLSKKERAANDCIVLCCSRARSPLLVLDL